MWYIFQFAVIFFIIYIYEDIPHPNETLGHVIALGFIVAYCLTWLISKSFDLLRWFGQKWRTRRSTKGLQHVGKVSVGFPVLKNLITKVRLNRGIKGPTR